jgi:hypothetical protein
MIRSSSPTETGHHGNLWDRSSTHALVLAITGIDLPQRTFSTYLDRWGFIAPRPVHRAHAAHPTLVKQWMMRDHPVLAANARDHGALLLWFDVHTLSPLGSAVSGVDGSHSRIGDHMLYLSNGRGHQEWWVAQEVPTIHDVMGFFERATDQGRRRLHLIIRDRSLFVDHLFTNWLAGQQDRLEVFFLPDPE